MSAWAKPGIKCVCVRTCPADRRIAGAHYPVVNEIYTVREIRLVTMGPGKGGACLLVWEITNSPELNAAILCPSSKEPGFPVDAFRPLTNKTIEDDMELFAPLLKVELVGAPA